MSTVLFQTLLDGLKRSNKERKLKLAIKAGYATIEEYKAYLENQINGKATAPATKKVVSKKAVVKPTIHIIDIIDCSGSMSGLKINNAVKGINQGVTQLKADNDVNYTYTLCDFSDANDIKYKYTRSLLSDVASISFRDRGMTALFDAIGKTLTDASRKIPKGEKVLVNIYTDGGENGSRVFNSVKVSDLIESLKADYTVTFIGTDQDVNNVIARLKIDESNTLKYDGSGEGLAASMTTNSIARSSYSKGVLEGKDVSKGFFKNIVKK